MSAIESFSLVSRLKFLKETIVQKCFTVFTSHKKIFIGIAIGIGSILFVFLNLWVFQYGRQLAGRLQKSSSVVTLSPTPTPIPIRYHGKMSFTVSSGTKTGPKFTQGFLDPVDPHQVKQQKVSLSLTSGVPVASASALWKTDSRETLVPLRLVEGTNTNGRWEGVWEVTDTIWYRFKLLFSVSDGTTTNVAEMSLR